MSYHTFVEQRVNTFEQLGGNGLGMKHLVTETSRGETSIRGYTTMGERSSGETFRRQESNVFYPLESTCVRPTRVETSYGAKCLAK